MINDHNSSTIPISRVIGFYTCMAKPIPNVISVVEKKLLLLYCIIIMNLQNIGTIHLGDDSMSM